MGRATITIIASFVFGMVLGYFGLSNIAPQIAGGEPRKVGAICGLLFAIFAAVTEWRRLARQHELRTYAARSSLRYSAKGSKQVVDEINQLTGYAGTWWLENQMQGRVNDIRMIVGDLYHRTSQGENNKTSVRTVVHFRGGGLYFPHFTLQPEDKRISFFGNLVGVKDLDFPAYPEFSDAYHLSSDEPETTSRLFNEAILKYFAVDYEWEIRAERDQIMMTRDELIETQEIERFINESKKILARFQGAVEELLGTAEEFETSNRREPRNSRSAPQKSQRLLSHDSSSDRSISGWVARRVKANTIALDDVERFVQLPVPRDIPAAIRRQRAGCGELMLLGFMVIWALMLTPFFVFPFFANNKPPPSFFVMPVLFALPVVVGIPLLIRKRRRNLSILRWGTCASAEIVGVRSTGIKVNSQPQFEVEFRYDPGGDPRLRKLRIYGAHGDLARDVMESGAPTPLLVAPGDPDHCVLGIQLTNPFRVRL